MNGTDLLVTAARIVRPTYQKFMGADAQLAEFPIAAVRALMGNYVTVSVDGHKIKLDLRDKVVARGMFLLRSYEPVETDLIRRLVEPGDTVVDVGANIGYYTILLSDLVGADGSVIAIEPDSDNLALLEHNLALNKCGSNIQLLKAAVSNTIGTGTLYRSEINHGDHRMWSTEGTEQERQRQRAHTNVDVLTLDEILATHERVDFVKMDIQGYEPNAVGGLSKTLESDRIATMLFEFWPFGLRGAGFDPNGLLRELWGHGMRTWEVRENEMLPVESLEYVRRFEGDAGTNILAANPAVAARKLARIGL